MKTYLPLPMMNSATNGDISFENIEVDFDSSTIEDVVDTNLARSQFDDAPNELSIAKSSIHMHASLQIGMPIHASYLQTHIDVLGSPY